MQNEPTLPGPLLDSQGHLAQVGWSRQPVLDCNLEDARFYALRPLQRFRIKRWDYYAVFSPERFFSATIADLVYAGNVFVYTLDFASNELHEEGLVIPLGRGIQLPRDSESGESRFASRQASLRFQAEAGERRIFVDWPGYHEGRGIKAEKMIGHEFFHRFRGYDLEPLAFVVGCAHRLLLLHISSFTSCSGFRPFSAVRRLRAAITPIASRVSMVAEPT